MHKYLSLVFMVLLISLAGCDANDFRTDAEIKRFAKHDLRKWKETLEGVHYFTTCAEGLLFIATPSANEAVQMAGPIGKC